MADVDNQTAVEWRNKNEKMKKTQFLRELEQIKLQKHTVERERNAFLYEKHDRQFSHNEDVEKTMNEELRSERLKLEQQLKKIRTKVNEFQRELKHVKPTPEFVQKLKSTMEEIESTIGDFKQKQRDIFETLMIAEKETEQEINVLEGKINAMKSAEPVSARSNKTRVKLHESSFPKEIRDFEIFVAQHGGMQGGWDDYDHGAFLRIREKFKGNRSFIPAAARQIPGRSEEDITDHEKWYSHFLGLKRKKKDAIATWRKTKEEKENTVINASVEDEETKKLKEEQEELVRKRLQEEREAKKEEVQTWRAQKIEEQRLEEEKRLEEERRKRAAEERKRKEKETEIQAVREKLKMRKEEEERLHWMKDLVDEQVERERQQEVKERIILFQTRDRVALSLKQNELKRKKEMENVHKERLEKTKEKVQVKRDPSRLYKLTKGWVHRTQDNSEQMPKNSSYTRMPHRAVPTWRQNL